jgi:DNA-binding CsgD family transcriptional regulator
MKTRGRPRHPEILTPRQQDVLALVRRGLTNEEIAHQLGISVDGVKYHVSDILMRLNVSSRYEAAQWQPATTSRWHAMLAPFAFLRKGRRAGGWRAGCCRRRGGRGVVRLGGAQIR